MRQSKALRACTGILLTVGIFLGAASRSAGADEHKAPPAAAAVPTEAERCPFVDREGAHCLRVAVELRSLPRVGEEATVTWTVDVAEPRRSRPLDVALELSPALGLVQPPEGARLDRRPTDVGDSAGAVVSAPRAGGPTVHGRAVVRALHPGLARIAVRATVPLDEGSTDGDVAEIPLTIGAGAEATRRQGPLPAPPGERRITEALPPPGPAGPSAPAAPSDSKGLAPFRPAGPSSPAPSGQDEAPQSTSPEGKAATPGAPGDTCVSGGMTYVDQVGSTRAARNMTFQVWDDDDAPPDDLLASGVTDGNGRYRVCFDGYDGEAGTNDVYVELYTSNTQWDVGPDAAIYSTPYEFETPQYNNVPPGSWDMGTVAAGGLNRPVHAFDTMTTFWNWVNTRCWDTGDATCEKVSIEWDDDRYDGDYYNQGGDTVHLETTGPDSESVVIHEATHAVMDDVYNNNMPDTGDACENHTIPAAINAACAWVEGFADWTQADARRDPWYRSDDGFQIELDNRTWGTSGWANGDAVEGRVAGALLDLSDSANEGSWDRRSEGMSGIWAAFQRAKSDSVGDFWANRTALGHDVSHAGGLAAVYGNTIDYGFRDPLQNYVEVRRPAPVKALGQTHNFSYSSTSAYWSVVAARPQAGADHDLKLFDDAGLSSNLATSSFAGANVDLIAVDSNAGRRPLGDYYPQVYNYSGTAGYDLELAQGTLALSPGTHNVGFVRGTDVVVVADVSMTAGRPVYFTIQPTTGFDAELYVFESDPNNSATWVRPRLARAAQAANAGAGGTERLVYTPTLSGYHGLVWVNKGGTAGTAKTYIDTTKPTGSVVINGGAGATTGPAVMATFTYTDAQTGTDGMRVSVDGTLDTEAWEPFVDSKQLQLPTGDGTKTVKVQYRNLAGMVSDTLSDTIVLDQSPPTGSVTINNGAASTDTRDVTVRYTWNDPHTNVKDMRVSVDGQMDTEPWIGPVTTQNLTLPPGQGNKVVWAHFRNYAGVIGAYSDRIYFSAATNLVEGDVGFSPSQAPRGGPFTVTDTLRNVGAYGSNVTSTDFYLSKDPYLDGTDRNVGYRNVGALAAGSSSSAATTLTVPGDIGIDMYFVIACADGGNTTPETSEADNCASSGAKILVGSPDLIVSFAKPPPTTVAYYERFPIENAVINHTPDAYGAPAPTSYTQFYASTDKVRSADDTQLGGFHQVPALAIGAWDTEVSQVWAHSDTPPGTYYVLACADDFDNVKFEQSEANNCRATDTPFTVR